MRSSNPALRDSTFSNVQGSAKPMTIQGTVNKTAILLGILFVSAAFTWKKTMAASADAQGWWIGGAIAGFIIGLVACFKKEWAPVTAPLYALAEGLFLGGISAIFNSAYNGIVLQAVMLTGGILMGLLAAYSMGFVKPTEKFKTMVRAATAGIVLVYLATWILSMFGVPVTYIHGSGMIGIGVSIFVVIIAALNLVLDFDFIEQGAAQGAPKYMEWYAGFGLLVTLVWLYLEILKLLAKLADRR